MTSRPANDNRPAIPEAVKREVRQRCGFGCVICGVPVYHYDHMVEWSEVREHKAENLVLLCPGHHQDKTSGRIDAATLQKFAEEPRNIGKDWTAPHLHIAAGDEVVFEVGRSVFVTRAHYFEAIVFGGRVVLGVSTNDSMLLFDIVLCDANGEVILSVERGELKVSTGVWDYRVEGTQFQIRSAAGVIELSINLQGSRVTIERGQFHSPHASLIIGPDGDYLEPGHNSLGGNYMRNVQRGLVVG